VLVFDHPISDLKVSLSDHKLGLNENRVSRNVIGLNLNRIVNDSSNNTVKVNHVAHLQSKSSAIL